MVGNYYNDFGEHFGVWFTFVIVIRSDRSQDKFIEEIIKKIVCLANSRKHSGRCIAGKEVLPTGYGQWIRPVSESQYAEISEEDRRYEDGTTPTILDIISIRMTAAKPELHQSENYTIDARYYWAKGGKRTWSDVSQMLDSPASIWMSNSFGGQNDRVSLEVASKLTNSLMIIEPKNLRIAVGAEGAAFGNPKRKVRAHFSYKSVSYGLIVTDPAAEESFLSKPNGIFDVKDTYLTISLGEDFQGSCYKLVAALIRKESF